METQIPKMHISSNAKKVGEELKIRKRLML
jgi:hypothetical protein